MAQDEAQAGHDGTNVMHIGEVNHTPDGAWTGLDANVAHEALSLLNAGIGAVILATGQGGGNALIGNTVAVEGVGGPAIVGVSTLPEGTFGKGSAGGVLGQTGSGFGVEGLSDSGVGVRGHTETGVAVRGDTGVGIGVEASSTQGVALHVSGTATFTSAGTAVIPAGQDSVFVGNHPEVTSDSHISVTLANDPGRRVVKWVERVPGSGFTVHLASAPSAPRPQTSLTFFVVEPASS